VSYVRAIQAFPQSLPDPENMNCGIAGSRGDYRKREHLSRVLEYTLDYPDMENTNQRLPGCGICVDMAT